MTTITAPVRKTRRLACSAEHAFATFTRDIGAWWPTATHAIGDDVVDVVLELRIGGSIHEVAADGSTTAWGEILDLDPPRRLRFSWHLARPSATEVEVWFTPTPDGCELVLEHRGWENWGDEGPARRDGYDTGWDLVLDGFSDVALAG